MLAPDATALVVDSLDELVGRVPRPPDFRVNALIITTDPSRRFLLTGEDGESIALQTVGEATSGDGVAALKLPAEALVRLVYGRLDPAHTPVVGAGRRPPRHPPSGVPRILTSTVPAFDPDRGVTMPLQRSARTPANHNPGSLWPSPADTAVSKELWTLAIGVDPMVGGRNRRKQSG